MAPPEVGYLVVMWACVEMAPTGLEGTTLALATTVGNAGQSLGTYVTMFYNGCALRQGPKFGPPPSRVHFEDSQFIRRKRTYYM